MMSLIFFLNYLQCRYRSCKSFFSLKKNSHIELVLIRERAANEAENAARSRMRTSSILEFLLGKNSDANEAEWQKPMPYIYQTNSKKRKKKKESIAHGMPVRMWHIRILVSF